MIDLHFHWAWILIAALIITGVYAFWYFAHDDNHGMAASIRTVFGLFILIICVLVGCVVGGIFIW